MLIFWTKVPRNRKNLRKLAADITKNVIELGKFYDERERLMKDSNELQSALSELSK
jgi:hypothetical protein